jgi:hypothetical protein
MSASNSSSTQTQEGAWEQGQQEKQHMQLVQAAATQEQMQ